MSGGPPPPQDEPGVPEGLHSLVAGHNDIEAQRTNMVFFTYWTSFGLARC